MTSELNELRNEHIAEQCPKDKGPETAAAQHSNSGPVVTYLLCTRRCSKYFASSHLISTN